MPGYGRSSKDAEHKVDFGIQAEALAALSEHSGIDSPHVVAHDFGGAVSLRAWLTQSVAYAARRLRDA
jgi:pimeloyl-ACP methyl ester carboxylesterase